MSATRSASCGTSTERLPGRGRTGFTLVELLWAMALSLVVMGAMASLFGVFTRSLKQAQAAADVSARLRSAAWRLRQDLSGVTVDLLPPVRPEAEAGYFEYFEGWRKDAHAVHDRGEQMLVADVDDVLMFTTRSEGQPFVGRYGSETIESPVAEVAWFCRPSTVQPLSNMTLFTLYRRQELVVPYVGRAPFKDDNNTALPAMFDTNLNDISVRLEGGRFVPNSLGDLTKRENRFLRGGQGVSGTVFPYVWASDQTVMSGTVSGTYQLAGTAALLSGVRAGEDVVLSNVLSFDVRLYDAEIRSPLSAIVQVECVAKAGSNVVELNVPPQPGGARRNVMDPVLNDFYNVNPGYMQQPGRQVLASPAFPGGATIVWPAPMGQANNNDWLMQMSVNAATSGVTMLSIATGTCLPGDNRYYGATSGTGARGGYVDLGWGGEFGAAQWLYPLGLPRYNTQDPPRVWHDRSWFRPPAAGIVASTFPPAGQTAFRTGGLRVRGGTLATGTTALDAGNSRTYDTWSTHYESNGMDEDGDGVPDEGTNGLDENNNGIPDDPAEAETSPPYPTRLRGLEIRIRCYEPESGQIRQTTLRHTFLAR